MTDLTDFLVDCRLVLKTCSFELAADMSDRCLMLIAYPFKKIRQTTANDLIVKRVLSWVSLLVFYFGGIMKTMLCATLLLLTSTTHASTMLLWSCKLLDGHTIDEVKAINSAWVDYVNELTDYQA